MSSVETVNTATLVPQGTWTVDPVHSSIRFDVIDTETAFKSVSGRFTDFEGRAQADGGTAISTNGVLHDEALAALARTPLG